MDIFKVGYDISNNFSFLSTSEELPVDFEIESRKYLNFELKVPILNKMRSKERFLILGSIQSSVDQYEIHRNVSSQNERTVSLETREFSIYNSKIGVEARKVFLLENKKPLILMSFLKYNGAHAFNYQSMQVAFGLNYISKRTKKTFLMFGMLMNYDRHRFLPIPIIQYKYSRENGDLFTILIPREISYLKNINKIISWNTGIYLNASPGYIKKSDLIQNSDDETWLNYSNTAIDLAMQLPIKVYKNYKIIPTIGYRTNVGTSFNKANEQPTERLIEIDSFSSLFASINLQLSF
ncbi:hypothetical protein [Aureivirga marina]|uniref:hypothetical protein n=1 Tax=Aureivirga marina TaxID=1182451 RepID=UPI0018C93BB6|nr:hypothetical protein [Aureivirga marina]